MPLIDRISAVYENLRKASASVGIAVKSTADADVTAAPTISSGAGAPTSAEPNGSVYLRTDGSDPLYARSGGSWAVSGGASVIDLLYSATAGSGGVASFDTGTIDCSAYQALRIDVMLRTDFNGGGASAVHCWYNGDTTVGNYYAILAQRGLSNTGSQTDQALERSSTVELFSTNDADSGTGIFVIASAMVMSPGSSAVYKHDCSSELHMRDNAAGDHRLFNRYGRVWANTAPITRIQLVSNEGGNFVENSTFFVYGVK